MVAHEDYRIWHSLARAQVVVGDTHVALENYEKALAICPDDNLKEKTALLSNLAGIAAAMGNIDRALSLWNQSLEILEKIGDVKGKAATLSNMAGVIAQQGDIDRALSLWNQSLEIKEKIGDVQGKAITLANMAGILAGQGDFDTAIGHLEESFAILQHLRDANAPAVQQMLKQVRQMQADS